MAFNYIVPRVGVLFPEFDCIANAPTAAMATHLGLSAAAIIMTVRITHEGNVIEEVDTLLHFEDGVLVSSEPRPYVWSAARLVNSDHPAFIEVSYRSESGAAVFCRKMPRSFYLTYWRDGQKSFLMDASIKYANPRIISQVELFGKYVDTYPVVAISKARDHGESFYFLNPYGKPVVVDTVSNDGRTLPRTRVPASSVRRLDLTPLLRIGEDTWRGGVQVTASNRIIVLDCKHSIRRPTTIYDCEHMEPFRAEPTHLPAFQQLRLGIGRKLANFGIYIGRS